MIFPTRIVSCVLQYVSISKNKLVYLQKHFGSMFCLLLIGFVIGNIFGTFLSLIRNLIVWDGLLIVCFLFLFEIFSYAIYHSKERVFGFFLIYPIVMRSITTVFKNPTVRRSLTTESKDPTVMQSITTVSKDPIVKQSLTTEFENPQILNNRVIKPNCDAQHQNSINKIIWRFANFFKIGLMIGFFVDAFKVGS